MIRRFFLFLCFASFSLFGATSLSAQPWWIDTINIPGYTYDPRFYIGVNAVGSAEDFIKVLYERVRGDYTYTYGGPRLPEMLVLRDSSLWDTDPAERFIDRGKARYWLDREEYPLKAMYGPDRVFKAGKITRSTENVYDAYSQDDVRHFVFDLMGTTADSLIDFRTQFMQAGRFEPCLTPPCDLPIAGWQNYTNLGLERSTWEPWNWYAAIGYADSSDWLDMTFIMQADTSETGLGNPNLPDNAVIAYATLYRRDTTAQGWNWSAPFCALYVPFKTLAVTKGIYLDSMNANVFRRTDGFREYNFPFRFTDTAKYLAAGSAITGYPCLYYDTTITVDTTVIPPDTVSTITTITTCYDTIRWGGDTLWNPYVPTQNFAGWSPKAGSPFCEVLDSVLMANGVLPAGTINRPNGVPAESDFVWTFTTTRRVRIDFLGGRVAPHTYRLLQRGDFDELLRKDIDSLLADPLLDTTLIKVAMSDEATVSNFASVARINSVVQTRLRELEPVNTRAVSSNPIGDYPTCRVALGDLDSTGYKPVHGMISQAYSFGSAIPMYYADPGPGKMSWEACRDYYKMTERDHIEAPDSLGGKGDENDNGVIGDTIRGRYIMGPSKPDYDYYQAVSQGRLGGIVNKFSILAAAARTQFSQFEQAVPYPVTGVIQVHGYPENTEDDGYLGYFRAGWRPTTPEEIAVQSWLLLHAGIDGGLLFSDFAWEGTELGVMNGIRIDTTTAYDTLSFWPDTRAKFSGAKWKLPKMWLGFDVRYRMCVDIVNEFKDKILPVYTNLDLFNGRNVCVHGQPNWKEFPMLSSVRAERADAFTVGGNFPTGVYDTPDSTYLETAIFSPTPRDTAGYATDSRYLFVTNRRLWPIAFKTYSSSSLAMCDSLAIYDTDSTEDYNTSDFGRIDVRRPVVVLKNSTQTLADSVLIEKVGYEGSWSQRRAFGDTVFLEFLNPGWGSMYRLTPIATGVSHEGTAFNNAVRSENPSTDGDDTPIMAVVERDSTIVLRTFDPGTGWTSEVMISAAADTVRVPAYGRRLAHNTFPAIATARDDSAVLAVWQRVDTLNRGTVEGLWIPGPPTAANLAAAVPLRLSPVRFLNEQWMRMTPAVVGVEGGWVVAYASPIDGIDVVALRNDSVPNTTNDLSFLMKVRASKIQFPARTPGVTTPTLTIDSTALFPTLAYVPDTIDVLFPAGDGPARPVHLAWQQSGHDTAAQPAGPFIFYCHVDVEFNTTGRPKLHHITTDIEHVTQGLPGCSFYHPSIGVDSTRIGVAFESRVPAAPFPGPGPLTTFQEITLRFRDSILTPSTAGARPWNLPVYYWGDSSAAYAYPSLTLFPSVSRSSLLDFPQGGIAWFDEDDGRTQRFYRFGEPFPAELPDGVFPTMTLSPYLASSPMEKTGVLYRGVDATSFERAKGWGDTGVYYPSRLLTNRTAGAFDFGDAFSVAPSSGGISSFFGLGRWLLVPGIDCDFHMVTGAILRDYPPHGEDDPFGDPPIGPGHFGPVQHGDSWIETTTEVADVVSRTGVFTAGLDPVQVKRYVGRTANAVTWLNTFPYDTVIGSQPDVKVLTELVRASDGAVLWRDDTLSVRDMSGSVESDLVSVPVDVYATPGTGVYIRLRPVTTMNMEYSLTGGFQYYDGTAAGGFSKRTGRNVREEERREGTSAETAGLRVQVIPNPARERAEVRIRVATAGRVRLEVYNALGEKVATLPELEATGAGEYVVEIRLTGATPGVYLLRAATGAEETTARFSVVR